MLELTRLTRANDGADCVRVYNNVAAQVDRCCHCRITVLRRLCEQNLGNLYDVLDLVQVLNNKATAAIDLDNCRYKHVTDVRALLYLRLECLGYRVGLVHRLLRLLADFLCLSFAGHYILDADYRRAPRPPNVVIG